MRSRANSTASAPAAHCTSRDARSETEDTRRDLSTYLQCALQRTGTQVKAVAFYWGTDHGYVSRVLSNQDPLPDHRLAQLPEELQRAVLEEWAADLGVTVGRKADLSRALEALVRLTSDDPLQVPMRMARATLPQEPV